MSCLIFLSLFPSPSPFAETAMLLPAQFGSIRTINETTDIRKNLRLRYPNIS